MRNDERYKAGEIVWKGGNSIVWWKIFKNFIQHFERQWKNIRVICSAYIGQTLCDYGFRMT